MEPLQRADPRQVGPYRLVARLGSGGMGRVYLGTSPGGREVAVKVVHAELAEEPQFRKRFAREVEAARKVGGFHTAQVVDADPDAEAPWMVTAYVPGPSLKDLVGEHGPLPAADLRELASGLAEGLSAIHAAGLVHRDLKHGNVIVAADGPRIIDFGIARAVDATALTSYGAASGTSGFMPPEQVRLDEAAPPGDVFALGCVLAFAATGRVPFDAETLPAAIYRLMNEEPALDGVPGELRPLVAACLAKHPADRPTVPELLAHLAAPRDAAPPLRVPSHDADTYPGADEASTHPNDTRHLTSVAPPDAQLVAGPPPPVARRALIIGGGAVAVTAALAVPAVALLRDGGEPPSEPARPGPRMDAFRSPTALLRGHESSVESLAFSPDGRTLASASLDETVRLWDVATGENTGTFRDHTDAVLSVVYSPDGRAIASSGLDRRVLVRDARTGRVRTRVRSHEKWGANALAFSPDGKVIAGGNPDVRLWNAASGAEIDTLTGSRKCGVETVAFSPDGAIVAAGTDSFYKEPPGSTLLLWDASTGRAAGRLVGHEDDVNTVAFTPDGRTIVTGSGDGTVRLWDRRTRRTTATLRVGRGVSAIALARDGRRLATGGQDRTVRIWDLASRRVTASLTGATGAIATVAFSPDGTTVACSGRFAEAGASPVYLWKVR